MATASAPKNKITKRLIARSRMCGATYHVKRDGVVIGVVMGDELRGWRIRTADERTCTMFTEPGPIPPNALDLVIARLAELVPPTEGDAR